MNFVFRHLRVLLILSGLLTFSMIQAFIAPASMLEGLFNRVPPDPLTLLIVRSWGLLIALVGLMLIHAAMRPGARPVALAVAGVSKAAFILLLLTQEPGTLAGQAMAAVVLDSLMVALFFACLAAPRLGADGLSAPLRAP